jgi:hypothetical protein
VTDQTLPTELPPSEHFHGCPAPPDRVESYPLERPDGTTVQVTRCVQCGGQSIDHNPKETDHAAR